MHKAFCRPDICQLLNSAVFLQKDEDSEEYGSPIILASTVTDTIKSRTDAMLTKTKPMVSSKPVVMRAEYAHCPNLTIIDTPGFILKAKKGEPESTPDEILSMVKSLASPPHRILVFLQQSSVEWCSSLWLDVVRNIDPTLKRTVIVVSKFDNRLKDIWKKLQLWKLIVSVFAFSSTPELMFGAYLLYYFRVFERQIGSNKYSVYQQSISAACIQDLPRERMLVVLYRC
ncbi:putative dynamin GTPase [Helianthus annuus]|nr:putative dynamin GTPase [Helianthus annuus]